MPFDRKAVFPYEVRGEKLFADPMVVYERLMEFVQGDLTIHLERAYMPQQAVPLPLPMVPPPDGPASDATLPAPSGGPSNGNDPIQSEPSEAPSENDGEPPGLKMIRMVARKVISDAMRHALELPEFDRKTGTGPTVAECEELYFQWSDWMEDKKKDSATSPTPSTASPATGSLGPWSMKSS